MTPSYINVGALTVTGTRVPSKKQLKELCASGNVAFDQTAYPHSGLLPGVIVPEDMMPSGRAGDRHIILSVVGPDPYDKRSWYANVELKNGKLVCK